jgi:hypothetical protein
MMKHGLATLGADVRTTRTASIAYEESFSERGLTRFERSIDWIFATALVALVLQLAFLSLFR